jgi:hypothetical protein
MKVHAPPLKIIYHPLIRLVMFLRAKVAAVMVPFDVVSLLIKLEK